MAELRSTPSSLVLSSLKGKTAPAVDKANRYYYYIICLNSYMITCLYVPSNCYLSVSLPASRYQGSLAEAMGEMVKGEAPQLEGTRIPWVLTGEARLERSAAFNGATLLN